MNQQEFQRYLAEKKRDDDRFDPSELAKKFIPHFRSGVRIKVRNADHVRTGRVGATTGWKPAFILMHRSNAHGSWDVLSDDDEIIGIQHGHEYRPAKGH